MLEIFQLIHYSIICWVIVNISWKLFTAFKTFVLPRVISELNLIEKFGSWAVITGSTDGIGKEFARELARRGLNIVLISRNIEKLERTASEIENEFKVKTKFIVADFCDGPALYEHIKSELENIPVGILVNNVAMTLPTYYYIDEIPAKLCWHMMNTNIGSAVMMTNLILPQMKKRKRGAIINISSGVEIIPAALGGLYTPSKAFMKNFSNLLQAETASFGITVQTLSPFFIKTNMLKVLRPFDELNVIFVASAETYAKHAIKTLGFSGYTCGFWAHGILYFFLELSPMIIVVQMTRIYMKYLRSKYYVNTSKKDG